MAAPGSDAAAATVRRWAAVSGELLTGQAPATARTSASHAGRVSTRMSAIPKPASWPSSRSSMVVRSQDSSAAQAPPEAGATASTIAVETAVGSTGAGGAVAPACEPPGRVPVAPLVTAVSGRRGRLAHVAPRRRDRHQRLGDLLRRRLRGLDAPALDLVVPVPEPGLKAPVVALAVLEHPWLEGQAEVLAHPAQRRLGFRREVLVADRHAFVALPRRL